MLKDLFQLGQPSLCTFRQMQVYDRFLAALERLEITQRQGQLQLSKRVAGPGNINILRRVRS
jgi:hypothetical protein